MILQNNKHAKKIFFEYGTRGVGGSNTSSYSRAGGTIWTLENAPAGIDQVAPCDVPFAVDLWFEKVEGDTLFFRHKGKDVELPLGEIYQEEDRIAPDTNCRITLRLISRTEEEMQADWDAANSRFEHGEPEKACAEFLALCEEGMARAAFSLGWCYVNGEGVEKDEEKGEAYYRLATRRGYIRAWARLGLLYSNKDAKKAEGCYRIGMLHKDAFAFMNLGCLVCDGALYNGNSKLAAMLATRAFALNEESGFLLGHCYFRGIFYPTIYPYAKYCFQKAGFTDEEMRGLDYDLPAGWEELEPIRPKLPDFSEDWQQWFAYEDPCKILDEVRALRQNDPTPEQEEKARDLCSRAATGSYAYAMYYTFLMDFPTAEAWMQLGADEYGEINCIETLAALYSDAATYTIGNPYLNKAVHYWNLRKRLHSLVPMDDVIADAYRSFQAKFAKIFPSAKSTPLAEQKGEGKYNAVLLNPSEECTPISVDFSTLEGLCAPLESRGVSALSTGKLQELSRRFGFTLMCYCDRHCGEKGLEVNERAEDLLGYDGVLGSVVLCGWENNDYAPLTEAQVEELLSHWG